MCSEDDECLAKNEQLLETYCSERYFLPLLTWRECLFPHGIGITQLMRK